MWLDEHTLRAVVTWRRAQAAEQLHWGDAYHDNGYVFTHEDGRPLHPDYVTKIVKRILVHHVYPARSCTSYAISARPP